MSPVKDDMYTKQLQSFWFRDFSLSYTKLATLSIKAYAGKRKTNSAKEMPQLGMKPRIFSDVLLTELS